MHALVLVTGGAGFIGSHLVDALLVRGCGVRVLDDLSTGKRENLTAAASYASTRNLQYELLVGDVRDEVQMRAAVRDCTAICHLAAVASVTQSVVDPVGTRSVTYGGTANALRFAAETGGVSRFVLASSCAVYGDAAALPVDEATPPRPLSPYAQAKLDAEGACCAAAQAGQLSAACFRFFNIYGPRQDPSSEYSGVISRFLSAASSRSPVTIYGDGEQTRDFVYVGDLVEALIAALERPFEGSLVLNAGSGVQTSIIEVLDYLGDVVGAPIERHHAEARTGDIRHSRAAVERAFEALSWRAHTPFAAGLARTWSWFEGEERGAAGEGGAHR